MTASTEKTLPYYQPENYAEVIDLPLLQPRQILVSEKEYLQLKSKYLTKSFLAFQLPDIR